MMTIASFELDSCHAPENVRLQGLTPNLQWDAGGTEITAELIDETDELDEY